MDETKTIKEQMEAQIRICEHLYNLPKRDLALHASLATKPQNRGELLGNAEVILNWLNQSDMPNNEFHD